ncbi:hypothetical protein [Lentibacillus sp. Marseille-P4043]|uniref:hypothetical protein n=1 Tax=Lentibacillus sp. Marseille-P4043 TaxID=2040293 RepID=UPI000D0B2611|nr:hypothetical protein [Lentibacillus sp. Marseille-P4043]
MRLQQLTRLAGTNIQESQPVLRQGQIIQGKILHLYPNNKAQIQLGTKHLIAQLEASLTTGESYHFQVQATGDLIRLRVLGDQLKNQMQQNVESLLKKLGLKATKQHVALLRLLMTEKIPFDKEQLVKAFQLIEATNNKIPARQIAKEMIAHKLPLTDSVFQALYTNRTSGYSDQMKALLFQLKQDTNQTPLQHQLMEQLSSMTERPTDGRAAFMKHIMNEVDQNRPQFFNVLKQAGVVDTEVSFASWKTEWRKVNEQPNRTGNLTFPFRMDYETSIKKLDAFSKKIGQDVQQFLKSWTNVIGQAQQNHTNLTQNEFAVLKQQIEKTLLPVLTSKQAQQIQKHVQNNPESLRHLLTAFESMNNDQVKAKVDQLVANAKRNEVLSLRNPRDQFLQQIRQVLNFTGLNYENQIQDENQSTTIKSMLIQLLQHSDGVTHDRSQQLLHFINGMQINSVHDSANFIQASIQLPGEKLALNQDVQLDFTGKKTEKGEISPDYCRILFYLDLTNWKETVIDMNVQKRSIAITIYNDHNQLNDQTQALKPILKDSLKELNYHLSTVTFKPLKGMKSTDSITNNQSLSTQGVDFRI